MTSVTREPKLRARIDDVKGALDELRLKMSLAGMELRDGWDALTPALLEIERRFAAVGREAVAELSAALERAGAALKQVGDEMKKRRH